MFRKCAGAHSYPWTESGPAEGRNRFSCYLHRLGAGIVQITLCSCTNTLWSYLHCPNHPALRHLFNKSWKTWLITRCTNSIATKFKRLDWEHTETRGRLSNNGCDGAQTPPGKYINKPKVGANTEGALTAFQTVPVTRCTHLPPAFLTCEWQFWFTASLQGHFFWGALPQGHYCIPMSERCSACLTLPGTSPRHLPAQHRAGLKTCCHHYCIITPCRESRSFPELEYFSPVSDLGCHLPYRKYAFCHSGWEVGSHRQLHF